MSEWITDDRHQSGWGIDVEGRTMWYEPWPTHADGTYRKPTEDEITETYGSSGQAVAETLLYFEECASRELEGSDPLAATSRLVEMLNQHVIDPKFHVSREVLLDESRWYNAEYYFYFIMFTKKVLGRYDFHFGEGSDEQLSVYHKIYEKGFWDLVPFGPGVNRGVKNYIPQTFIKSYTEEGYNLEDIFTWLDSLSKSKTEFYYKYDIYDNQYSWVTIEFIATFYELARVLVNIHDWTIIASKTAANVSIFFFAFVPKCLIPASMKRILNESTTAYKTDVIKKNNEYLVSINFFESELQDYSKYRLSGVATSSTVVIGGFRTVVKLSYKSSRHPDFIIHNDLCSTNFSFSIFDFREQYSKYYFGLVALNLFVALTVILNFSGLLVFHGLVVLLLLNSLVFLIIKNIKLKEDLILETENNEHLRDVSSNNITELEAITQELLLEKETLEQKVSERTADLARANEQLKELDAAKTNFFMNVSHELRTPLTLILAPLEAIRRGRYGSTLAASNPVFCTMEKNGQRLLKLISNVLDFSKIEAGRMQVTKKPVDIGSLVTHCVSSVHSAAAGNGILLQTELSHERIVTLADPELMENALFNLISNAIKFNREGGRVTVRMKSTESILTISVEDTGIGIPEEYRERIFERFGQVDASSNRKYEGTGIGLALTKEIIEMHDGSISLESEENQGSVFTLQVPLLSPEESENLAPVVFEEELQREAVYEPEVVVGSNPGPLEREAIGTVLVVEDNEDMRNILAFLLEEKYRVIQATQGKEALALLEEHGTEIDLVLSDVTMPVMDGFELVDAVRENGQWRYLPIVLLTARADVQDTVHGITSGANDYIAKPFNREELMVRVDSHLKLKQLHDRVLEQKADLDRVSRERTVTDESREKIDLVLSFIRDNFREDLSREGLAAAVEMSPDHLSRTFKKHTGKRINEVINELRVQEAARLISGTDEKIITICHDVGFESLRTFNRVFSGIKGISPSEWRKNGEISQSHEGVEIISQDDLDDLKSIAETREEESIPHSELQK